MWRVCHSSRLVQHSGVLILAYDLASLADAQRRPTFAGRSLFSAASTFSARAKVCSDFWCASMQKFWMPEEPVGCREVIEPRCAGTNQDCSFDCVRETGKKETASRLVILMFPDSTSRRTVSYWKWRGRRDSNPRPPP
jgi:hypothetical protein